ncbi:MAG: exodeoxyribonuclease VII small subunit [bacterium]
MVKKTDLRFEDALEQLEKIVTQLEEGDVSLDNSLKMFEEGIEMSRICAKKLEEAERKIEILTKTKDGKMVKKPFELAEEDDTPKKEAKEEEESNSSKGELF